MLGNWNEKTAVVWILIMCCRCSLQKKNNVLFIIVDDLKPSIGSFGDSIAHTPNLDKLSEKSFLFSNAFAQQALCAPSRNSLMTSRRPDSLHLYDFYNYWRTFTGNFTTLPQHFKENGYFTHSVGKVFHPGISSNFSDDSPYSWSDVPFHPRTEKFKDAKVCKDQDGSLHANLVCPVVVEFQPLGTLPDLEALDAATLFLRNRANKSMPYFLAVGFHKPHIPLKFPAEYLDFHPLDNITLPKNRWKPSLLPPVAWNPWNDVRRRDDIKTLNISFPYGPMPDDVTKKIIQSYNAAVTYIDDLIGKLLATIDDNTIIIVTSDHGWSIGQHGEFSKFSNFIEATRVPLIIHVPKLSTRKVVINELVELVDLFPTLVELTQVSEPLNVCPLTNSSKEKLCTEGRSLVPVMVNSMRKKKIHRKSAIFTQYPRPGSYPTMKPDSDRPRLSEIKIMGYSVKTKRYRYADWVAFDSVGFKANWTRSYGVELYDHLIDPKENMNLADRKELKSLTSYLREKLILGWRYA